MLFHVAPAFATLRGAFAHPSGAVREMTGPLFWLHGTESESLLREYVGRVDESGQGILTIESRPHVDWMRAGWWRDVGHILDECRQRGMKVMIFDDYWWPSQGMGGKYPIPKEYQCRDIKAAVYAKGAAPDKVENEICRVSATETAKGVFRLGPAGDKVIVYSWFVARRGRIKGLGGRFPYVNGLDEAAVDWFLDNYYKPYYDRYRSYFEDGTIVGFFFDEPETVGLWGPAFEKELAARGDNVGELLTAYKFRLADPEAQARAAYRYHDARAEAWGRTMYGRQSDWCRRHGVFSSGHFMEHANCYYSLSLSGGNVMQLLKYVEVPGVDLVCRQYYPHQRTNRRRQIDFGQMPKYASSAAHVYNRHNGLNWCEIFGAYGQDITYPQMKWLCDWHQYQGCYYLIPHSFNPRAPHDRDCPPYFYNGGFEPRYPLFRIWADYNNRCALMVSGGEHVCHIAQCLPGISYHVGRTIRPEMFAFAVQDAQLDSDWMDYDAVSSARIGRNPRTGRPALRTRAGKEWYDVLSLPATEMVPFPVLEKALAFAQAGGVVVGYGIRPSNTPTRGKTAADVRRLVDELFAQPTALFLTGEPDGAQLRAALARPYPGTDKPLAVRAFDFPGLTAADGQMLAVNHTVKNGAETLFIANQDCNRRRDISVRTVWPAAAAELWDPMQGTVERPVVADGCIKLALEPSAAVFLVWPKTPSAPLADRVEAPVGVTVPVAVTKTVTPVEIAPNAAVVARNLKGAKWIWHPACRMEQGEVTFRTTLTVPATQTAHITFACDNAAIVRVNGREIARRSAGTPPSYSGWTTPGHVSFTLRPGDNTLEVLADNVVPGYAGFVATILSPTITRRTGEATWTVARRNETPVVPASLCAYGAAPWYTLPRTESTTSPFAESVTTTCAFTLPDLKPGERVYFVCDGTEGEKSAALTVNGVFSGGFIGAPFRTEITASVRPGANSLCAKPFTIHNPRIVIVR